MFLVNFIFIKKHVIFLEKILTLWVLIINFVIALIRESFKHFYGGIIKE